MTSAAARQGTVGILPVGALGVAFYFHLTRELQAPETAACFLERSGSRSGDALRHGGTLCISAQGQTHRIPSEKVCRRGLLACAESDTLPEVIIVCTQSDQILSVITNYVELLEWLHEREGLDAAVARLPLLVLSANGIYHQRVRRFLVEALEESTLYGRLPDLWSESMGHIVGKLLRGVTMQTGRREGSGLDAVYFPGLPGRTRVAGGELHHRRRAGELLQAMGGKFEVAEKDSPTRVEFDKALVNLFANLLGQFLAIDEEGCFHAVKVRDIISSSDEPTRELARHVIAVGRAVHAYRPDEDFETIYLAAMNIVRGAMDHVPSSIQWIEAQLRAGTLTPHVTPTEKWLLEPLIRYASHANLEEATHYFNDLVSRLEKRFARAIERRSRELAGSVATPSAASLP